MAALPQRVKNALDEARILMLGTQVLLGFQYRAFFEARFGALPALDRALQVVSLFALLAVLAILFLLPARHRIVEGGEDTPALHAFTRAVMQAALAPFTLAIALALFFAGDVILGRAGAVGCGAATAAVALLLWYGHFARPDRRRPEPPEERLQETPLEHRVIQVLTEARVVLPGAQALLGFQLTMILTDGFQSIAPGAKVVHLASIGCIALATLVLMAPAAYHRIVEGGQDSERFHRFASRMVLIALALLAPGLAGDLYVVLTKVGLRAAAPIALATVAVFWAAWFGAMLILRSARARR